MRNEGIDMYADDPAPTLILQCGFCARHIAYYGDADDADKARDTFTIGAYEQAVCECGAVFGEDDVLDVVWEDDAPTASDSAAELAALRDENARLRQAMGEAAQLIKDDYQGSALAVLRAALEVAR